MYKETLHPGGTAFVPVNDGVPSANLLQIKVDISAFGTTHVNAKGYLVPGAVVKPTGVPPDGTANEVGYVVTEAVKFAPDNASGTLAAAQDRTVVVQVLGVVHRKRMEANLGRVLTANELAAIGRVPGLVLAP